MGVDAFVMPLWRFKVGDFESPIERLAGAARTTYFGPGGVFSRARLGGLWARRRARRQTRAVASAVAARNGHPIEWPDDGEVVRSEQFRAGDAVKAYMWWLDRRDLVPDWVPSPTQYGHPFYEIARDRERSLKHLGANSFYNDYVLPCEFEHPVQTDPYVVFDKTVAHRSVTSAPRVLQELDQINATLQAKPGQNWDDEDPLAGVGYAYLHLRDLVETALAHRLPLIFWG